MKICVVACEYRWNISAQPGTRRPSGRLIQGPQFNTTGELHYHARARMAFPIKGFPSFVLREFELKPDKPGFANRYTARMRRGRIGHGRYQATPQQRRI